MRRSWPRISSKKGRRSSCWSSERLREIESDSKERGPEQGLMQLQYPTGQGEERAVEFAILESKLPVCTEVPRTEILGSLPVQRSGKFAASSPRQPQRLI